LTLVIFLVIQNFVAQPYQVQQMSMENTLQPGEYVLVDKLSPRFDDYSRGDVVVFSPPAGYDQGGNTPFIKRVIGLPGDTVAVSDGQVVVNGKPLTERYIFPGSAPYQPTDAPPDRAEWTIAVDELFVLGDHRAASSDSRVFGPIKRDTVIGRAWLRYWPFAVFGILPTPIYPELQAGTP
jgi:signal peptidase I